MSQLQPEQLQPEQLQQPQPVPQQQQQQQQQQPVLVYPNNVNKPPPSHHSNGSFGSVFIVLAVIVVISGIACFLGRLCNRDRSHKPKQNKQSKQKGNNNKSRPKEGHHGDHIEFGSQHLRAKDGADIELGFDKRIPSGKPSGPNYATRESRGGPGVINHNKPFGNAVHHHDMKLREMKPGGGGGSGRDHVVMGEPRARG